MHFPRLLFFSFTLLLLGAGCRGVFNTTSNPPTNNLPPQPSEQIQNPPASVTTTSLTTFSVTSTQREEADLFILKKTTSKEEVESLIEWTTYEDKKYGITFSYPNKRDIGGNDCVPFARFDDEVGLVVPVTVVSQDNQFLIRNKFDYKKSEDGSCLKKKGTFVPWDKKKHHLPPENYITVEQLGSEEDINNFIKRVYHPSCSYGGKRATAHPNTYNILINSDVSQNPALPPDCWLNFEKFIKYNPKTNQVVYWHTGQWCEVGFQNPHWICLDKEIGNSFHFID